jgi:uncharacterized protein YjbI with pentapeptide repeats
MSDKGSTDKVDRELQRLGDEFAQDWAEALARERPETGEVVQSSRDSDWSRATSSQPQTGSRLTSIFQFIVITLALAGVIYLVFELTATVLTHIERAALILVTIGFLYMVASIGATLARRFSDRAKPLVERNDSANRNSNAMSDRFDVMSDRFDKTVSQLEIDRPAIVRLAGVFAMEALADEWQENRQACINVLCGYLRLPYYLHSGDVESEDENSRRGFPAEHEIRRSIVGLISAHMRDDSTVSWRDYHIDLSTADLHEFNLMGAVLTGADFTGVNLADGVVSQAILIGVRLDEANLTNADLIFADLTGASLIKAQIRGAGLVRARLLGASLTLANLADATLMSADLRGAYLTRADLTGANLTDADLTRADLTGANLTNADLTRTDLTGANLTGANLTGANLTGADLTGANLTGANLTGANLTRAHLALATFAGALWPSDTEVPEGWQRDADSGRLKGAEPDPGSSVPD